MTSNENQSKLLKYKMDHAKRGKALVININKYEPPKNETNSSKNEPLRAIPFKLYMKLVS